MDFCELHEIPCQVSYDPRSYERNLCNCVYRSLKKFRTSMGFEPMTLRVPCHGVDHLCSTLLCVFQQDYCSTIVCCCCFFNFLASSNRLIRVKTTVKDCKANVSSVIPRLSLWQLVDARNLGFVPNFRVSLPGHLVITVSLQTKTSQIIFGHRIFFEIRKIKSQAG